MLNKLTFIFFLLFVFLRVEAQHLIESIELAKTKDNVVNIYQNNKTGEIFRHYSNSLDTSVLDLGVINDIMSENIQEGIIWEDGENIQFSRGEHFLSTNDDYILTVMKFWDNEKQTYCKEVRRYSLFQRSLLENEEKLCIPKNDEVIMLSNGNFIVSNFSGDYGTKFSIYSNNLELLESYNPFILGFENIQFAEKNNILLAVSYPTKTYPHKVLKMMFISATRGTLFLEKEVHDNFSTNQIFALDDLFILYGVGWLNVFNTDGKIKWDRTFDKPLSIFEDDQGEFIYIVTEEEIYCLKKKNGKIEWLKNIFNYYPFEIVKELESIVNVDVTPIGIYSLFDGSEIGLILGQKKDALGKSNLIHQITLLRLDKHGEFINQVGLASKSKIVKLISESDSFKVITDKHIKIYSK